MLYERPKRDELEGSTLAPNFPKVIIKKPKDMNGPFYFDDVPVIRYSLIKSIFDIRHIFGVELFICF